jgi:hypothetical protein
MLDSGFRVNLVNNPVGILLDSCCKNNNLIVLAKLCQELDTERPDKEVRVCAIVDIVD